MRSISQRVVAVVSAELRNSDTQLRIKEHIVLPLVRLLYETLFPYVLVGVIVVVALLTITAVTLAVLVAFYVRSAYVVPTTPRLRVASSSPASETSR